MSHVVHQPIFDAQPDMQPILIHDNDNWTGPGRVGRMDNRRGQPPLNEVGQFLLGMGAYLRTLCAIGFALPTSMSHIYPRAAGGRELPLLINIYRVYHIICGCRDTSSGAFPSGSGICITFNTIASRGGSCGVGFYESSTFDLIMGVVNSTGVAGEDRSRRIKTQRDKLDEPGTNEPRLDETRLDEPRLDETRLDEPRIDEVKLGETRPDEPRLDEGILDKGRLDEGKLDERAR